MRRWTLAFFAFVVPLAFWVTTARAYATEPGTSTAIVAVHGGGWYGGTPAKMDAVCRDLSSFAPCYQPAYTLSGEAAHAQQYRDLRNFVAALRGEGYTRVIGVGASAGGNLVGTLAQHGIIDAAVTLSAPTRLTSLADWYRDQCGCWVIDQFAPTPEKKAAASPALASVDVPVLIYHSQDEALIPRLQALKLAEVSPQATLRLLPGTRHAMSFWDDVSGEVAAWIGGL